MRNTEFPAYPRRNGDCGRRREAIIGSEQERLGHGTHLTRDAQPGYPARNTPTLGQRRNMVRAERTPTAAAANYPLWMSSTTAAGLRPAGLGFEGSRTDQIMSGPASGIAPKRCLG